MALKLLHTADMHIGAKFLGLGDKGQAQRSRLLEAFEEVAGLAVQRDVDLLLIAGDLFDSNRVSRAVLERVAARLRGLSDAGIEICISPGTHDPYSPTAVYLQPVLRDIERLRVFDSEVMEPVHYPELDCKVYGNANMKPFENKYPLDGLEVAGDCRWRIGMLHANFEIPDVIEDTYVVSAAQIASSGLDYLALGHLHSLSDRSAGGVHAYYPGSPEMVRMQKGEFGNVLFVELDDGVRVEPIRVAKRRDEELTVIAEDLQSTGALVQVLEGRSDPDKVMRLFIEGFRGTSYPDVEGALKDLSDRFFHIILTDSSVPAPTSIDPQSYPAGSPSAVYLEVLESKLADASSSEKEEIMEAMQVGLSVLGGGGRK